MDTLNTQATAEWIYPDLIKYVQPYWTDNNVRSLSRLLRSKAHKQGFCLNHSVEQHIIHQIRIVRQKQSLQEAS